SILEYLQNGIVLYSLVGLLIMGVQLATIPLFQYMGQPAEVIEAATPYYMTLTLGMLPLMIFFTFKQFLEGLGNTKVAMYCVIISNVVNVFFNWVFISGNLGAPELGATGAGIATLISRVLMAVMLVLYFFKSGEFGDYIIRFARVNIKRASQLKLVMMGIPISSQIFLEVTAFVITGVMCGWLGTTAITANQIGMTLGHSAFAIVMSIGVATTIRISHCFGRRSIREMRLASKAAWHLGLAWNVAIAIFFITLSGVLPKLFSTNAEVIDLASTIIIFIVMYQIPDGVQSISVGILRGMQDVRVIIPIAFISYWVVAIPVGYLFAFPVDWGPKGLYVGHIFGLSTASILMIWRIKWGQNRLLRGAK
ncbi:MAG: MATE family efflux transporter, partial [Rikenellaceae bacterium]